MISEKCCNFKVLRLNAIANNNLLWLPRTKLVKFSVLRMTSAKFLMPKWKNIRWKVTQKRKYHRDLTLSKAEIMILYPWLRLRCLKHFYLLKVCKHIRHLFPKLVVHPTFGMIERNDVAESSAKRDIHTKPIASREAAQLWADGFIPWRSLKMDLYIYAEKGRQDKFRFTEQPLMIRNTHCAASRNFLLYHSLLSLQMSDEPNLWSCRERECTDKYLCVPFLYINRNTHYTFLQI